MGELSQTFWSRIRGNNVAFTKNKENVGNGKPKGSVRKGDQCSFRHVRNKHAKATTQPTPSPEHTTQGQGGKILAISKSPKRKVRLGKYLVNRARNIFKVLVRIHLVKSGIPSSACFTRQKRDANSGISASSHTAGLKSSPAKGRKRMAKKVQ